MIKSIFNYLILVVSLSLNINNTSSFTFNRLLLRLSIISTIFCSFLIMNFLYFYILNYFYFLSYILFLIAYNYTIPAFNENIDDNILMVALNNYIINTNYTNKNLNP